MPLTSLDSEVIRLLARMSATLNPDIGANRFEGDGFSICHTERE